jgi:hypothetical protein
LVSQSIGPLLIHRRHRHGSEVLGNLPIECLISSMGIPRQLTALVLEELAKQCRYGKAIVEGAIVGNFALIFREGYVEVPRRQVRFDDAGLSFCHRAGQR